MIRRLALATSVAAALALPAAASATPTTAAPTTPTTPPAQPAVAKMSIEVASGIVDGGTRWVLTRDKLLVLGKIREYVAGEKVTIELSRAGKVVDQRTVKVEAWKGTTGKFQTRFKHVTDEGRYSVTARHDADAAQEAGVSNTEKLRAIQARVSGKESTRLLQIALNRLAFVSPISGHLDEATRRAVLAYRKVNHWKHTGSPTSTVFRTVFNGRGGFNLRYSEPSMHVEGDLSRQVLVLADNGHPVQIYTMSSGKSSTPTVRGKFKFYRRQAGTNSHGMVWSTYFHGGYAIHGYPSVPATYPASHGCLRVPIPNSYHIYKSVRLGETIYVYL
jgi:lipoprotein-anchoring transpeptidase ErfK/SrfK